MMYLVAILVVLIMIVFIKVIRTTPDAVVNHPTAKAKHDPEDKVSMSTLFAPHMIASYVLYFATCYGYYMVVTWLPSFLQQERGFEGVAIGFSSAVYLISFKTKKFNLLLY